MCEMQKKKGKKKCAYLFFTFSSLRVYKVYGCYQRPCMGVNYFDSSLDVSPVTDNTMSAAAAAAATTVADAVAAAAAAPRPGDTYLSSSLTRDMNNAP